MGRLLTTQTNVLKQVVKEAGFRLSQFEFDFQNDSPSIRVVGTAFYFHYEPADHRQVRFSPDAAKHEGTYGITGDFGASIPYFRQWLAWVKRETAASENSGAAGPPGWLDEELPQRYKTLGQQIEGLTRQADALYHRAALVWQTGDPLAETVRDFFRDAGYRAELTGSGSTYDITVDLDAERRFLIEVTGIEGAVNKASGKISQVFQTCQMEARDSGDRVLLVANAFRSQPPQQRTENDAITRDALRLVSRLGANFATTTTLYRLWAMLDSDRVEAIRHLERLHSANGEHFVIA